VQRAGLDPNRFVFLDETWVKTNMTRVCGRAPSGERLIASGPHGQWKTTTLLAALRTTGLTATLVVDGALNGDIFRSYVEKPTYTVDGLDCRDFASTIAEFNRVLGRRWGEDDWDGNLDAFNDIIDWPHNLEPYILIWAPAAAARGTLGHDAMAAWLRNTPGQCAPGYGSDWRSHVVKGDAGRGPTLFDWLVETIADCEQIRPAAGVDLVGSIACRGRRSRRGWTSLWISHER
jgi:hypothetical protein